MVVVADADAADAAARGRDVEDADADDDNADDGYIVESLVTGRRPSHSHDNKEATHSLLVVLWSRF